MINAILNGSRAIFYDACALHFWPVNVPIVFLWTGESDSNTLRVNAYFFEKGQKISPFSKIPGYVRTEPKLELLMFDFHLKLHLLSASFASLIPVFAFPLTGI